MHASRVLIIHPIARLAACWLLAAVSLLSAGEVLTFAWSGGVSDRAAQVVCKATATSSDVRIVVSASPDLSNPVYSSPAYSTDAQRMVRFADISGLSANTTYYYGISVDGTQETVLNDAYNGADPYTGSFTTLPTPGSASSFSIVLGACLKTEAIGNEVLFDTMRSHQPLFWMSTGDFHYSDIGTNSPDLYRAAIEGRLVSGGQGTRLAALSRMAPFVYMWDDHDFGPNNSWGAGKTDSFKQAAHLVYRQFVPHHDLSLAGDDAFTGGEEPIAQAFTVGRVRFILTDVRSESTGNGVTLLGSEQKAWFKRELLAANGTHAAIVWLTTVPWNGSSSTSGGDRWQFYSNERREIADFLHANNIQGFCALSGDMHGTAIDDGTNTDFTTGSVGAGFPLFHAAPLSNRNSYKGGPYSEGYAGVTNSFGLLSVADDGDNLTVTMTGKDDADSTLISTRENINNPLTYSFTLSHPLLIATQPLDDATGIDPTGSLVMTFSETVALGSGAIEIRAVSDDSLIESLSVAGDGVTVSGNQLTITPSSALPTSTACYVVVDAAAVLDLAGSSFAGISGPAGVDAHVWSFTTGGGATDTTPPAAPANVTTTVIE
jgi:hypothetical protein